MNNKLPEILPECNAPAKQFCNSCRSMDAGRDFRATILTIRGIEADVDFECPLDKPWASRGLGDTIAKATKAIGIKPCGGCKKRQAKLNKLIPYKDAP